MGGGCDPCIPQVIQPPPQIPIVSDDESTVPPLPPALPQEINAIHLVAPDGDDDDDDDNNIIHDIDDTAPVHEPGGNGKRNQPQRQIGTSSYAGGGPPRYLGEDGKTHMMPRPLKKCFKGEPGFEMKNSTWLTELAEDLYLYAKDYCNKLKEHDIKRATYLLDMMEFMIKHVPKELRIGKTPFTLLSVVGQVEYAMNGIQHHIDKKDALTLLLHIGNVKEGTGTTEYYSLSKKLKGDPYSGELMKRVPFKHGQVQIGSYDECVHGCTPWQGHRYTFSFNIKYDVCYFFKKGYWPLYRMWVCAGRPMSFKDCPQHEHENGYKNVWRFE